MATDFLVTRLPGDGKRKHPHSQSPFISDEGSIYDGTNKKVKRRFGPSPLSGFPINFDVPPSVHSDEDSVARMLEENSHFSAKTNSEKDQLFNIREVIMLCTWILRRHEGKLNVEYNKIIDYLLIEQYNRVSSEFPEIQGPPSSAYIN
ncbi:hypothetical protein RF11_03298 [Thelohanellus kitauei]|uniref:Uncharacterized protein n=1 Tax=Thelohanellus kitauei TaxID=669202 RepID=A0A0C2IKH0_THEKT|nr:hypothetical protein RF11_03298 [Thelohanellus kitauei]